MTTGELVLSNGDAGVLTPVGQPFNGHSRIIRSSQDRDRARKRDGFLRFRSGEHRQISLVDWQVVLDEFRIGGKVGANNSPLDQSTQDLVVGQGDSPHR